MKNKKGFTLIELLAVIVILAIIALIATPIILNMINDARKSAAVDSAYGYIESIEYANSMNMLDSEKYKMVGPGEDLDVNSLDVKVKGTKPESGTVTIDKSGRVTSASIVINGYEVKYDGKTATIDGKKQETEETNPPSEEPEEIVTGPTQEIATNNETYKAIVYLDPTDLTKQCDATNSVSTTGTKTGCMKWYAYKDDGTNYTMILAHNTTPLVAYNSEGSNTQMKEVSDSLTNDTTGWKGSPRLITADEIAEITGNNTFDSKTTTSSEYFYFETNTTAIPNVYSEKYAWLYDNTGGCKVYGCNISDDNKYEYGTAGNTKVIVGYWTSTPVASSSENTWCIGRAGSLGYDSVKRDDYVGIRPVITIEKSLIK